MDTMAFPMHNRTCRSVMGRLVGNNKATNCPASKQYFGFNLNFNDVPLGNANALHSHKGLEWFLAYTGDFEIRAGQNGGARIRLAKGDLVLVPPDVDRYFKCAAETEQLHRCAEMESVGVDCAMILSGTAGPPWVQWATDVVEAARERGVLCTDAGILYDSDAQPPPAQEWREVRDVSQAELESFVRRAADLPCTTLPHGDGDLRFEYVEVGPGAAGTWTPDLGRNYVVCHLRGPALHLQGCAACGALEVGATLGAMEVLVAGAMEADWSLQAGHDEGAAALLFVLSSSIPS